MTSKGYETYVPTYRSRRQWSDRTVETDSPLFPGYIFCRFDSRQRLPVITTPGVVSILGFSNEPTPIPDSEIEAVELVLQSGLWAEPHPFIQEGDRVRVKAGPLEGVEGILIKKKSDWRLVVSVNMLQRSLCVEMDKECIEAA